MNSKFDSKYYIEIPETIQTQEQIHAILLKSIEHGASDVFFTTSDYITISRLSEIKVLNKRKLTHDELKLIISFLSGRGAEAALNSGDLLNFEVTVQTGKRGWLERFRGNAMSFLDKQQRGFRITCRVLAPDPVPLEKIDMEKEIVSAIESFNKGLFIFVGGTGTGKSTSLFSLIDHKLKMPSANMNFVGFEHPIETILKKDDYPSSIVLQAEAAGKHVKDYLSGIKNTLRMATSHALIGEVRSYEEIREVLMAANTGQGVFTTAHANNIGTAVGRLIAQFPTSEKASAQYDLIDLTQVFAAQALVPCIGGGRIALREYLILNADMRRELREVTHIGAAIADCVNRYGMSFVQCAKEKYEQGLISNETFRRVQIDHEGHQTDV